MCFYYVALLEFWFLFEKKTSFEVYSSRNAINFIRIISVISLSVVIQFQSHWSIEIVAFRLNRLINIMRRMSESDRNLYDWHNVPDSDLWSWLPEVCKSNPGEHVWLTWIRTFLSLSYVRSKEILLYRRNHPLGHTISKVNETDKIKWSKLVWCEFLCCWHFSCIGLYIWTLHSLNSSEYWRIRL